MPRTGRRSGRWRVAALAALVWASAASVTDASPCSPDPLQNLNSTSANGHPIRPVNCALICSRTV